MKEEFGDLLLAIYMANEAACSLGNVPDDVDYDQVRKRCEQEVILAAEKVKAALNILKATQKEGSQNLTKINLFVDGACSGNPGPGGWAFRIETNTTFIEGSGFLWSTTNNQMEISAAKEGIEAIRKMSKELGFTPSEVNVYSDSQYVTETMKGNYKKKANLEWWSILEHAVKSLLIDYPNIIINWVHVAGHNNHEQNERVDHLAKEAIKNGLKKIGDENGGKIHSQP